MLPEVEVEVAEVEGVQHTKVPYKRNGMINLTDVFADFVNRCENRMAKPPIYLYLLFCGGCGTRME